MESSALRDRYIPVAPLWLGLGLVVAYALGFAIGSGWLLPFLVGMPAWAVMARSLRQNRDREAVATMLAWALGLVVVATTMPLIAWDQAEATVFHGAAYRDEMWRWLQTGVGAEGNPRQFIPQHLLHLGLFVVAAILTGSVLAILLGSVLMGYMGFYVASLIRCSSHPILIGALGWHPWSLLRVTAFVILGVVLGAPRLRNGGGFRDRRGLLILASTLLVCDLAMKTWLAEPWRVLLLRLIA